MHITPMTTEEAAIHILTLVRSYKNILHWQVTSRIALGSLYLDGRVLNDVRDEIDGMISSSSLLKLESLLE